MIKKKINLTDEQKAIAKLSERQHLVLAPPGTGKTELLAHRVDLALQRGVPAADMICLTFTNRAANGMMDRIEEKHPNNGVFVGNIHKFCFNFLFKNKLVPQFTSLMDDEDSEQLLEEAKSIENFEIEVYNSDLLKLNTTRKQHNLGFPRELLVLPRISKINKELINRLLDRYEQLKDESSLLDFDDLLTYTYSNLITNQQSFNLSKYNWIQVDEVQDLNPVQWEIIKLISTNNTHKVFFGDYEQAIFSFMGAKLDRLHSIERECQVHNLQRNFRSPSYLLELYVQYAKTHLTPRWKKDPIPDKKLKAEKDFLILKDVIGSTKDEANYIVTEFLPFLTKDDGKQTAILVRWNKTADLFGTILKDEKIEHFKISGYDLFRRKIIKDLIAFLSCLENKLDRVSWFRMFHIFGKIATLIDSRHFVNSLFENGFLPTDFLSKNGDSSFVLSKVLELFESKRIVVFDTETTGLDTENDDIIQIAAVEMVKGKIGKTFEVYIYTDKDLNKTEKIHNISKEFLQQNGLQPKDALQKFNNFINGNTLIAHNLGFDWKMLKANNHRYGIESLPESSEINYDSVDITRRLFPKLTSYSLTDLLETFEISGENTHNALDDVKATVNLLQYLIPHLENRVIEQREFYKENEKVILEFRNNLSEFWRNCKNEIEEETSLTVLINNFIEYIKKSINYKLEENDHQHLAKILRHMEDNCNAEPLKITLKKYIPQYKLFKESDLIMGDEKVIISTIHKAKGLEFENVIIPECVNDVYPSWSSHTEEATKEDARTLYVALSRAIKRLIITSHSKNVNQYGNVFRRNRSYFINCIEQYFNHYDRGN